MKDIVRQAVADAAEWLYQNRSAASQFWLGKTAPDQILRSYAKASQFDAENRRKEQLADFVADPVQSVAVKRFAEHPVADAIAGRMVPGSLRIDNLLISGPGGEMARTGGFVGRAVMVDLTTGADGKVSAREHVPKAVRDFNKDVELPAPSDPKWSVAVTASFDGAEGEGRVWLSTQEDDEPMIAIEGRQNAATLASMLIDWMQPDVVVVPRALLERAVELLDDTNPGRTCEELRKLL